MMKDSLNASSLVTTSANRTLRENQSLTVDSSMRSRQQTRQQEFQMLKEQEVERVRKANKIIESNVNKIQNPVAYLQEMCTKYGFAEPTYGILQQNGPLDTSLSIFCQVQGFYRVTSAKTQEEGKQMAARQIIACIKNEYEQLDKSRIELLISEDDSTKDVPPKTLPENLKSPKKLVEKSSENENPVRYVNHVGILQEFCVRQLMQPPKYGTENVTGTPNNPSFYIFCEVGTIKGYGIARNKKSAKQMAAEKVLEQLQTIKSDPFAKDWKIAENDELDKKGCPLLRETPQETFSVVPNPVGHLQELCVKNRLSPPAYAVVKQEGPSHCPTFVTSCKVEYFYQEATSSNKKKGKELVALKILKCLLEYRSPTEDK